MLLPRQSNPRLNGQVLSSSCRDAEELQDICQSSWASTIRARTVRPEHSVSSAKEARSSSLSGRCAEARMARRRPAAITKRPRISALESRSQLITQESSKHARETERKAQDRTLVAAKSLAREDQDAAMVSSVTLLFRLRPRAVLLLQTACRARVACQALLRHAEVSSGRSSPRETRQTRLCDMKTSSGRSRVREARQTCVSDAEALGKKPQAGEARQIAPLDMEAFSERSRTKEAWQTLLRPTEASGERLSLKEAEGEARTQVLRPAPAKAG